MRVRTRGSLSASLTYNQLAYPLSCTNRVTYWNPQSGSINDFFVGDKVTTIDTVTPDYWKRRKRGDIILNPYSSTRVVNTSNGDSNPTHTSVPNACIGPAIKSVYINGGKQFAVGYRIFVGVPVNTVIIDSESIGRLLDEVWTECLSKIQSGATNLSESLAELDKSYEMLRNPLENVVKFIKDFRAHGKRKRGFEKVAYQSKDLIVFVSSEWLRFRYGITPLVNDVKAVMKALKTVFDGQTPRLFTTRASGSISRSSTFNGSYIYNPYVVSYGISRAHQISVRATHIDKFIPTRYNTLGLTFQNVVGLGWELTRYSFVVDWFVNIGDLIYANVPRVGLTSYGGVVTSKEIITALYYPTGFTNYDPVNWTVSGSFNDSYLMTNTSKNRTIRSDSSSALVLKSDFRFDHFNRAADAATLLISWLNSVKFG